LIITAVFTKNVSCYAAFISSPGFCATKKIPANIFLENFRSADIFNMRLSTHHQIAWKLQSKTTNLYMREKHVTGD
jgi:hypothetical protein